METMLANRSHFLRESVPNRVHILSKDLASFSRIIFEIILPLFTNLNATLVTYLYRVQICFNLCTNFDNLTVPAWSILRQRLQPSREGAQVTHMNDYHGGRWEEMVTVSQMCHP